MILNQIVPYFQPIIAIDTNKIYAYEVLGRYIENDTVKSLGPFFSTASNEEALKVDRIVRRQALERFAEEANGEYLFINMRLEWLAAFADRPADLPTIKWARELGIDPAKLVIEITEEELFDNSDYFLKVLSYYRDAGCRIAIDDYGRDASHIDRLVLISPDILKVDRSYVQHSEHSFHYSEYLKMLSSFAEQFGIVVLYEGIENQAQLDICIASKGRLYQGFLLAKPQPQMKNAVVNHKIFSDTASHQLCSQREISHKYKNMRAIWDARFEEFFKRHGSEVSASDMDGFLENLCQWLPNFIKKTYVCSCDGIQLSHNIEIKPEGVVRVDYRNRNWAWRGFFRNTVEAVSTGMKSWMSTPYLDVTSKEEICTYSHVIRDDLYVFIDVVV